MSYDPEEWLRNSPAKTVPSICPMCHGEATQILPDLLRAHQFFCQRCGTVPAPEGADNYLSRKLGQMGIDVRQSGNGDQMRHYLSLLHQEIEMTQRFLMEDTRGRQTP